MNNKPFFHQPVKNKQEADEKLAEMSRNNDFTTGNRFDQSYHQNYDKLIDIDLCTSIPQQVNFIGTLEEA